MKIVYESPITSETEIEDVGYYGMKWLEFMENHHPNIYRRLDKNQTLYDVARSVDKSAWEYRELLDRQYEQLHPRPYEWEDEKEHSSWKFTRNFHTDGTVMREKVLIKRTAV